MLAVQRDAGAEALRRLAELRRRGTPGATALTAELDASSRDALLCDAVLSSRVSAEGHSGTMAIGLFPYGSCMGQLVADLGDMAGTAPSARSSSTLRREALGELDAIQNAYPLALCAAVRAGSPGCSTFRDVTTPSSTIIEKR